MGHSNRSVEGDEAEWFRAPFRDTHVREVQRTITVTNELRNALVDSGFVVFTPLTNGSHYDHFHIALPDTADAAELAASTTNERREQIIADDLARAAGRQPAP